MRLPALAGGVIIVRYKTNHGAIEILYGIKRGGSKEEGKRTICFAKKYDPKFGDLKDAALAGVLEKVSANIVKHLGPLRPLTSYNDNPRARTIVYFSEYRGRDDVFPDNKYVSHLAFATVRAISTERRRLAYDQGAMLDKLIKAL